MQPMQCPKFAKDVYEPYQQSIGIFADEESRLRTAPILVGVNKDDKLVVIASVSTKLSSWADLSTTANLVTGNMDTTYGGLIFQGFMEGGIVKEAAPPDFWAQTLVPRLVGADKVLALVVLKSEAGQDAWADNPPQDGTQYVYKLVPSQQASRAGGSGVQTPGPQTVHNGLRGLQPPGREPAVVQPPAEAASPTTGAVQSYAFGILLAKDPLGGFNATDFNKSTICQFNSKLYTQFCHAGEETMLIYLCDNPLVPIAAVANAKKASFIFSEQAANAGLNLSNFTEFIEDRLGPMVKRLEANLKPAVTYEQKFDQLKSKGFWACDKNGKQPYFLKASAYKQLSEDTLRSHLIAHGLEPSISRHETKESKIARLTALAATKESERIEALEREIERVQIDTDPSWRLKWQISLPTAPEANRVVGGKAKATDYTAKKCSLVWKPGIDEPQASIKIAQDMAALLKCTDHCAAQRFNLVVHWGREITQAE